MPSLNHCWGLPGNTSSPSKCSCEPPFRHKGSSVPGVGGGGGGALGGGVLRGPVCRQQALVLPHDSQCLKQKHSLQAPSGGYHASRRLC